MVITAMPFVGCNSQDFGNGLFSDKRRRRNAYERVEEIKENGLWPLQRQHIESSILNDHTGIRDARSCCPRKLCEFVLLDFLCGEDMSDSKTARQQCIRYEFSVASPEHGLGAAIYRHLLF